MKRPAPDKEADRKLRVAHVTFGLDVGGLEKLLVEFAAHADPNRQRLTFVSLGDNGPVGEEIRGLGWPVVCLHRPAGVRPSLFFELRRVLQNIRADVVHTHDARALVYGAPAAWLTGVPRRVHTQHGQCLGLTPRQRWMFRRASRLVDRFVCVSDDTRLVAESLGVDRGKTSVVLNGVNTSRFRRPPEEADQELIDRPLVCVSRLSPEKGVSTLLKAVSIAVDEAPTLSVEIAGDGPCREALEREAHQLRIDDRVTFLGRVRDVPSLLRRAKLFVLPSDSEGVSLTLLEAMSTGVPVVATRVGGTPEVLAGEDAGLLVPPQDPQAMASAIALLWRDRLERLRLAEAGRRRVVEAFDVRRMVEAYEGVYGGGAPEGLRGPHFALNAKAASAVDP